MAINKSVLNQEFPVDIAVLKEIGLTDGEVKVYLALLRHGSTKTGRLALEAGVSTSKVYKILGRLEKKGLAGHAFVGGIKSFRALEPKRILDYLDESQAELAVKKLEIIKLLPELVSQQNSAVKTEASLYDGFKAVTNFFRNILDDLSPGETYFVIGGGYGFGVPRLREFFRLHHQRRAKKKIKVKMLANFNLKNDLEKATYLNSEIRYLPQYLITNMEIVFYKDKVFIALFTKEPKGFLVESEEAVKSFQAYFNAFWKIAKA